MLSGHADSSLREGTKSTFTFIMCHYWKRLEGCSEGVLTDISTMEVRALHAKSTHHDELQEEMK